MLSLDPTVALLLRDLERVGWARFDLQDALTKEGEGNSAWAHKEGVIDCFCRFIKGSTEINLKKLVHTVPEEIALEGLLLRFEALTPFKGLVSRLYQEAPCAPDLAKLLLGHTWRGMEGVIEHCGLTCGFQKKILTAILWGIYCTIFQKWLDDQTRGISITMASLDQDFKKFFIHFL